ncbi:MAG: methylenetetrahydrofolate--tRNA-(uracil(54)-C(5))-methyltransferase (FADH(2)-oxidizing) TrmFO, partial [Oscillospiraceae bacterium]
AGLAGCEAASILTSYGIEVNLYEQKPLAFSAAHHYAGFAELVCSNSLKAARVESASGLLKAEMRLAGSLLLSCADRVAVAAGGALAVDREAFSHLVTEHIRSHPHIVVREGEEKTSLPDGPVIVATGPLTSDALAESISALTGRGSLSFYDAAAPIVTFDSIDMERAFFAARYGRGEDDYINCPMDQAEYEAFHAALISAEHAVLKDFDKMTVYEGCMPIETLAARGLDAIRYGPLKPVGLRNPRTGKRPWAVAQLRAENAAGSLYNLVGFQTNLKFPEQQRVFSMLPGLEHAEFVRFGVMHRNTFLDSPRLLDDRLRLKAELRIRFAGQMTGVEGYMESAASGLFAGIDLAHELSGRPPLLLSPVTMMGALLRYVSDTSVTRFQPIGASMGLLPPPEKHIRDKQQRYAFLADRALRAMKSALSDETDNNL